MKPFPRLLDRCGGVCIRASFPKIGLLRDEWFGTAQRRVSVIRRLSSLASMQCDGGDSNIECPDRSPSRSVLDLWSFLKLLYLSDIDFHSLISHRWSEWQSLMVSKSTLDSGISTCASQYPLATCISICASGKHFGRHFLLQYNNESACVKSRFHRHELSDARAMSWKDLNCIQINLPYWIRDKSCLPA